MISLFFFRVYNKHLYEENDEANLITKVPLLYFIIFHFLLNLCVCVCVYPHRCCLIYGYLHDAGEREEKVAEGRKDDSSMFLQDESFANI